MAKKQNDDQLLRIIAFAVEQNKGLMPAPEMPAEAFPYYLEGKLVGYGLAIKKYEKERASMQEDIAEMLAIVMQLKDNRAKAPKPAKPAPAKPAKVIQ